MNENKIVNDVTYIKNSFWTWIETRFVNIHFEIEILYKARIIIIIIISAIGRPLLNIGLPF